MERGCEEFSVSGLLSRSFPCFETFFATPQLLSCFAAGTESLDKVRRSPEWCCATVLLWQISQDDPSKFRLSSSCLLAHRSKYHEDCMP